MPTKEESFFTKPINIFIIAVIANALWGSAFAAIKIGCRVFAIADDAVADRFVFAGVRFFLAGLLVMLFACISSKKLVLPHKRDLAGIFLLGGIQTTLQYVFFYISLVHLTGVKGSIINASGNFFAVILAALFFKNDRMTVNKTIGCMLGFAGVVICNLGGTIDTGFSLLGEGFMLLAAFCFASGGVITKVAAKNTEPTVLTGCQLFLGGSVLALIGLFLGGGISFLSPACYAVMAYLAALSAVAFSLWAMLLKYNPVGKISLYGFLNPIFGVILSGLLLGEQFLSIKLLAALACVSAGIYIVNKNNGTSKN